MRVIEQPVRLGSEHDVVQRAQGLDEHEVLMHHANAQGDGFIGIADARRFAKHFDLPAVGTVETVQDGHQGTFTRAVLAHDAVHCAHAHPKLDVGLATTAPKRLVIPFM